MSTPTVRTVALDKLTPDPANIRKSFDKQGITTLAANLKARGVLTPLLVREEKKRLIIVDGERRYRAAKVAKLKAVPVVVLEAGDAVQRSLDQVAVNSLREPLKPLELGRLLVSLRKEHKLSDNEIAAHLDKQGIPALSKGQMAELMRLVDLPGWAQGMVDAGHLMTKDVGPILGAAKEPKVLAAAEKRLRRAASMSGVLDTHQIVGGLAQAYDEDKGSRDLERTWGYGKEQEKLIVHFDSKKACAGCEHLRVVGHHRICRNPAHFEELNTQAKEAGLLPGGRKPEKAAPAAKASKAEEKRKAERKEQNQGRRLAEYLDGRLREKLIEVIPGRATVHDGLLRYLAAGMPDGRQHGGTVRLLVGAWQSREKDHHRHEAAKASGITSLPAALTFTGGAIDDILVKSCIRMLEAHQVHWLAHHLNVKLADFLRIDEAYLALLSKDDLVELSVRGKIEGGNRMTGKALKAALLASPEAIAAIGVPAALAELYDREPEQPEDEEPDEDLEDDDDLDEHQETLEEAGEAEDDEEAEAA